MAREKVSYFPHYVTMSDDQAIVMLDLFFREEYDLREDVHYGYEHYNRLLEYAAKNNSDTISLATPLERMAVAKANGWTLAELDAFVNRAVEFGLFDASIWREFHRLTSNRMHEVRAYINQRSECGKLGGRPPKKKAKS